jgi:hypothetical protein
MCNLKIKFFFGILFTSSLAFSQEQKLSKVISEIQLGGNTSVSVNQNTEGRLGFGFGAQKVWRKERVFQITTGIHYLYAPIFVAKEDYMNHFGDSRLNLNKEFHVFQFPVTVRFQFGDKTKFFVEPGMQALMPIKKTNFNVGPRMGIGSKFDIKNQPFVVKADYFHGLINQGTNLTYIQLAYFALTLGIGLK